MPLAGMSRHLRVEAVAVGLAHADIVIALCDGGAGLEDCLLDAVSGLSQETIAILDLSSRSPIVIESACQRVVGQCLKRSGMRWREPGTHALCQARSLDLSSDQRWEFFWSRIAPE